MKLTQAQIEAAAKVLNVSYENKAYAMKMAKRVLTSAAEAEETNEQMLKRWDIEDEAAMKAATNATIERCAQWLEANGYAPMARAMRRELLS